MSESCVITRVPQRHDGCVAYINSSGINHVRLTVTDIAWSKAFYDNVFGWPIAVDATAADPAVANSPEHFFGGVLYRTPQGTLFGLRPASSDAFDATRTGLDHISFSVDSRADLDAALRALDDAGIAHGDVIELAGAGIAILSFQDPDDINIELTAPLAG